jgi:hypothetical protein
MSGSMNAGITKKKQLQIFSSFGRMVFGAQKLIERVDTHRNLKQLAALKCRNLQLQAVTSMSI